jgi:hypothetical protein
MLRGLQLTLNDKILLDSDVFRHFYSGNQLGTLASVYPGRICFPDLVKDELQRSRSLIIPVNEFISNYKISVIPFPSDIETNNEYDELTSRRFKGQGESACLAMARFHGYCLASSNIKDILYYCQINKIRFVTTMDILVAANKAGKLTVDECNDFIKLVKRASRLPYDTIEEYVRSGNQIRTV